MAAHVSRAFNDRPVFILFAHNDIFTTSLATGLRSISSNLLSVIQVARLNPQVDTVISRFWSFNARRNLRILRDFIGRSHHLKEIQLSFHANMLEAHMKDTIFPYSFNDLLTGIHGVFRAMAAKTPGPVAIAYDSTIWMEDIRISYGVRQSPASFSWSRRSVPLDNLTSVHLLGIESLAQMQEPFKLIVFNADTEDALDLGLGIRDYVDPASLRQFLLRHPLIAWITAERPSPVSPQHLRGGPLAMVLLEIIECSDISELVPLLDAFEHSPQIHCTIDIPLNRQSPSRVGSPKLALRRLSIFVGRKRWEEIDDEERRIIGCVYDVERVDIRAFHVPNVRLLLSWIAMLPSLVGLEFTLYSKMKADGSQDPTVKALLEEARLTMPGVPPASCYDP
ncbi:hypothetical protein C8R44DRAFT_729242 [Mycena epipterygia]|nr:hypothetical protein C8R44DRAFT_729242 [Mycena epipterygia]